MMLGPRFPLQNHSKQLGLSNGGLVCGIGIRKWILDFFGVGIVLVDLHDVYTSIWVGRNYGLGIALSCEYGETIF